MYFFTELPIQRYNTPTVTHLSGFNDEKCRLFAVLLCPSLVLYALLESVLVYFSCSLEKLEFVKSGVKCWEISHCLHHRNIPTEVIWRISSPILMILMTAENITKWTYCLVCVLNIAIIILMTLHNNYQPGRDGAISMWINHKLAIGTCIVYLVIYQCYKSKYKYEENIKEFLIFQKFSGILFTHYLIRILYRWLNFVFQMFSNVFKWA